MRGMQRIGITVDQHRIGSDDGATAAPPVPALFAITDDLTDGEPLLRRRPGWASFCHNAGARDAIRVDGGHLRIRNADGAAAFVDCGRTDALFVEARLATLEDGVAGLWFRMVDELNGFYLKIVGAGLYVCRMVDGAEQILPGAGYPDGHAEGDLWRAEISGDTAIVLKNGLRFPDGATGWDLSALPACGRVGFNGQAFATAGGWSGFRCGHLSIAQPRLALDPLPAVLQRRAGTAARALSIGGDCAGVSAIECRLVLAATGAPIAGWDWGERPLTGLTIADGRFAATTAPVPQGGGYRLELRAADDHAAGSISNRFGVGMLVITYGQSNAAFFNGAGMGGTVAAGPNSFRFEAQQDQPTRDGEVFNGGNGFAGRGSTWLANRLAAATGMPVALLGTGHVSEPIGHLRPGSAYLAQGFDRPFWSILEDEIAFAGGDAEALVYAQGESDAGLFAGDGHTAPASYRAALGAMHDRLLAITGRQPDEFTFGIAGLGRLADLDAGDARGAGWDAIRRAQAEWCHDTAGAALLCSNLDLPPHLGETPQPHYAWDESGLGELGKRAAAGLARLLGFAATDRRGPIAMALTRSGTTLSIRFDLNGAATLACAGAIASNFAFATDSGFATPLAPTAMTIAGDTMTWQFAAAPPATAAARGPQGVNPDIADALVGRYPDGGTVIALPLFTPLGIG